MVKPTPGPHIGTHGIQPGNLGYEFDCELGDCHYHYHPLDERDNLAGVLEIVPPEGKVAHMGIGRLIQAAPELLAALEAIAPADEPIESNHDEGTFCWHCGAPWSDALSFVGKQAITHAADCAWIRARAAIAKAQTGTVYKGTK